MFCIFQQAIIFAITFILLSPHSLPLLSCHSTSIIHGRMEDGGINCMRDTKIDVLIHSHFSSLALDYSKNRPTTTTIKQQSRNHIAVMSSNFSVHSRFIFVLLLGEIKGNYDDDDGQLRLKLCHLSFLHHSLNCPCPCLSSERSSSNRCNDHIQAI